jgi:hypothetical protein
MRDWSKIISEGWVQLIYLSVNPPWLYPQVTVEGTRESGTLSPARVSPHLGTLRQKEKPLLR